MVLPDIDDVDSLGGQKQNQHPVEDPTTDLDAADHNAIVANVAAATHTNIRAWMRFTTAATTGALVLEDHDSVWGNAIGVAPTMARVSAGVFDITWPAAVVDELGVSHTPNFREPWVNVRGATLRQKQATVTAPNVVRVYTALANGTADDIVGSSVGVLVL